MFSAWVRAGSGICSDSRSSGQYAHLASVGRLVLQVKVLFFIDKVIQINIIHNELTN